MRRTRFEIRSYTDLRLSMFRSTDPRIAITKLLLREIILDGQPCPRVERDPIGNVEVTWLADGNIVALVVEHEGYQVWAETADGQEVFAYATESHDDPRHPTYVRRVQQHLVELGKEMPDG